MASTLNLEVLDKLLDKLDTVYTKLADISQQLSALDDIAININLAGAIGGGVKNLDKLTASLKRLTQASDQNIRDATQQLRKFISALNSLSVAVDDEKFASLNLSRLIKALKSLSSLQVDVKGGFNQKYVQLINSLIFIVDAFERLNKVSSESQLKQSVRLANTLQKVIREFSLLFGSVSIISIGTITQSVVKLRLVTNAFSVMLNVLGKVGDAKNVSSRRINSTITSIRTVLIAIFDVFDKTSKLSIGAAAKFALQFILIAGQFVGLTNRLATIAQTVKLSDIKNIGRIVEEVRKAVFLIFVFYDSLALDTLRKALSFNIKFRLVVGGFVTFMRHMTEIASSVSLSQIKNIGRIVTEVKIALNDIIDLYVTLKPDALKNADKFNQQFVQISRGFITFTKQMAEIAKNTPLAAVNRIDKIIDSILKAILAMERFYSTVLAGGRVIGGGIAKAIGFNIRFNIVMSGFLSMTRNLIFNLKNLEVPKIDAIARTIFAVSKVVDALAEFYRRFSDVSFFGAIAFTIKFRIAFEGVISVVRAMARIARGANPEALVGVAKLLRAVARSTEEIVNFYRAFAKKSSLIGNPLSLAIKLRIAMIGIIGVVRVLAQIANLSDADRLQGIAAVTQAIASSLQSFTKLMQVIATVTSERTGILGALLLKSLRTFIKTSAFLGLFITTFATLIGTVVRATKGVSPGALEGSARVLEVAFRIFQKLLKLVGNFDFNSRDVKRTFKAFEDFSKSITRLFASGGTIFGGRIDTSGMAATIEALGKVFNQLIKLSTRGVDMKKLDTIIAAFQRFVGAVGPLFRTLRNVNIKNANNLDKLVVAFANAFKILQSTTVRKFDYREFKAFATALSEGIIAIVKSLEEKIDLDNVSKLGDAVESIVKANEAIERTNLGKNLNSPDLREANSTLQRTADITANVRDGVLQASLRITLIRLAFRGLIEVVKLFNPVRIFQTIVSVAGSAITLVNNLRNSFDNLKNSVISGLNEIKNVGDNILQTGQNLLQNFGINRIIQSDAFSAAVEFDKLTTQVQVFGRLTDEETERAQDFANVIGKDYPQSANEALQATLDLIKAGQDLGSVEFILPSAADLSALSDTGDLKNATQILIGATGAFDEFTQGVAGSFDNIAVATNIISGAADVSTASVESLGQGLANVGPIANQFGLDFSDVNAILATFEDGQLRSAEAGTALRSLLTNLNTDTARNELKRLGVALTDSQGNFRNLDDIIKDLNTRFDEVRTIQLPVGVRPEDNAAYEAATKTLKSATRNLLLWQEGLASGSGNAETAARKIAEFERQIAAANRVIEEQTGSQEAAEFVTRQITTSQQEQAASIKAIFGAYGQTGASILLAANGFGELREEILSINPASERARQLLDNFAGDVLQLQGSFETLQTRALTPLIEEFFRPFVRLGRLVIDTILTLDDSVIEFISTGVVLASTLATVAGSFLILFGILTKVGAVVGLVGVAFTSMTSVIAGGLAIFASAAAGAVILTAAFAGIVAIVTPLVVAFRSIQTIFSQDLGGARTAFEGVAARLKTIFGELLGVAQSALALLNAVFGGAGSNTLEDVGEQIASFFTNISEGLDKAVGTGAFSKLQNAKKLIDGLITVVTAPQQRLRAAERAREQLAAAAAAGVRVDDALIQREVDKSVETVNNAIEYLAFSLSGNTILQRILGRDQALTPGEIRDFLTGFSTFATELSAGLRRTFSVIPRFFQNARNLGIGPAFKLLKTALDRNLGDLSTTFLNGLRDVFRIDTGDLSTVFSEQGFVAGIEAVLGRILNAIKQTIINNKTRLGNAFASIAGFLFNPLKQVGFIGQLFGSEDLVRFSNSVSEIIEDIFGGLFDTAVGLLEGKSLVDALREAFGPNIDPLIRVIQSIGGVVDSVLKILSGLFGGLADFGGGGTFASGLDGILQRLEGVFNGIAGFFERINVDVLQKLAQGDVGGALAGLGTIVTDILTGLGNLIKSVTEGLDANAIFSQAANAVVSLFFTALKVGLTTFGNITGLDVSGILATIETTLQANIDTLAAGGSVFQILANSIVGLFATALTTAFTTIGTVLNIDTEGIIGSINSKLASVLERLDEIFNGTEFEPGIFDSITTIINNLATAFSTLFSIFSASPDVESQVSPLQKIVDFFGQLASFSLDLLIAPLEMLNTFLAALAEMTPAELTLYGVALLSLAGGLGAFVGLKTLSTLGVSGVLTAISTFVSTTSLTSMLSFSGAIKVLGTALTGFASSIVGKAVAFLGIISFFSALAQNLEEFKDIIEDIQAGNIAGAISELVDAIANVLVDTGFNFLEALGIDNVFGATRESVKQTLDQIKFLTDVLGVRIKAFLESTVGATLRDIQFRISLMISDLELLASSIGRGDIAEQRVQVDEVFNAEQIDTARVADLLSGGALTIGLQDRAKILAQQFAGDITKEFVKATEDGLTVDEQLDFSNIFRNIEDVTPVLSEILASGSDVALQNFLTIMNNSGRSFPPDAFDQLAYDIGNQFRVSMSGDSFESSLGQLNILREMMIASGLSTTGVDAEIARIESEFASLQQGAVEAATGAVEGAAAEVAAQPPVPIQVPTSVTALTDVNARDPDLIFSPNKVASFLEAIAGAFQREGVSVNLGAFNINAIETKNDFNAELARVLTEQGYDVSGIVVTPEEVTVQTPAEGQAVTSDQEVTVTAPITIIPDETSTVDQSALPDLSEVGGEEGLQTVLSNLTAISTQLPAVEGQLKLFAENANTLITPIQNIESAVGSLRDTALVSFVAMTGGLLLFTLTWLTQFGLIQSALNQLKLSLLFWPIEFMTTRLLINDQLLAMQKNFEDWRLVVAGYIYDIQKAIQSVGTAIADVNNLSGAEFGGAQVPTVPGAATGAKFGRGDVYEVAEAGASEIMRDNRGRLFLLGGAPGEIIPMADFPNISSARGGGTPRPSENQINAGRSQTSNSYISIQEGDIIVQVSASPGMSEQELANRVRQAVREEQANRNRNVKDTLRTNHRRN